jgi:hypothetical protein
MRRPSTPVDWHAQAVDWHAQAVDWHAQADDWHAQAAGPARAGCRLRRTCLSDVRLGEPAIGSSLETTPEAV